VNALTSASPMPDEAPVIQTVLSAKKSFMIKVLRQS
jgi:hypothetical protein